MTRAPFYRGLPVLVTTLLFSPATAAARGPDSIFDVAVQKFQREAVIEAAGLFWIAAEVAILFAITLGRERLASRPVVAGATLSRGERRRALLWGAAWLLLCAAVMGRHLVIAPMPDALRAVAATGMRLSERAAEAYHLRTHLHLGIWLGFIHLWVLLEIAIVVQGIRAWRLLRGLVRGGCHA